MKVSTHWLKDLIALDADAAALAERLTLAGLEVDEITPAAADFSGVVVARITDAQPHPDADRLQVCTVDAGNGEPLQIVCGAPNARAGLVAPLATVGGELPGDDGSFKIKQAKLRGVASHGMLCSARELGLGDSHAGLLELPDDLAAGDDLRQALGLDDQIIDIELTPNRGDCAGMTGVARELSVLYNCDWTPVRAADIVEASDLQRGISIEDGSDCPAYFGRVIEGVDASATTPVWLRERLRRAGLRPKSPLVDVTNYVLLELGQPMHAFDADRLRGDIVVRRGKPDEPLTLLNKDEIVLDEQALVITDDRGAIALAGAMGGDSTAVGKHTSNVFLESACFSPQAVAGTGRRYKIHSDALYRYERGVDPSIQRLALDRATELVQQICGGTAGPVTGIATSQAPRQVTLRAKQLARVLGGEVAAEQVADILSRLGFAPQPIEAGWACTVPPHRYDVTVEVDLIEEIARVVGYDNLPGAAQPVAQAFAAVPEAMAAERDVAGRLVARGYTEAITFSFVDAEADKLLGVGSTPIAVDNPIAQHMGVMRTQLWAGLLDAYKRNAARSQGRVRLFESGLRFEQGDGGMAQTRTLAGLAAGAVAPEHWTGAPPASDFYAVKADLDAVAAGLRAEKAGHPALHPGQSARLMLADTAVGWLGVLHPSVAKALDVPGAPVLFQLDLDALLGGSAPSYAPLDDQPTSRRDLALVVDEEVSAADLTACVRESAGPQLREVRVFDIYRGAGLPDTSKSMALGLIFQDKSRTLADDEIDAAVARVCEAAQSQLGATVRQ